MKDLAEVCPLSREVMLQPLSFLLQEGVRFLRFPLPAISSAYLTAAYRERKISGLPCFARVTEWVRSALSAGGVGCPREGHQKASTRHGAFWLKLVSIFSLSPGNDVYQAFTCVDHTTHPSPRSALMLAGLDVASRFHLQRFC